MELHIATHDFSQFNELVESSDHHFVAVDPGECAVYHG